MPINSRAKGANAEREAAKEITAIFGVSARRGQQFAGGKDSPDLITGFEGVHFEVKHVQNLNLRAAYEQAERDAGEKKVPVVMHKRNRGEWFFTFKVKDVWRLFEQMRLVGRPIKIEVKTREDGAKYHEVKHDFCIGEHGRKGFMFNRDAVEFMFDSGWLTQLAGETAGDTCNRVLGFLKQERMIK